MSPRAPDETVLPDDDARTLAVIRRRFSRTERAIAAVAVAVGALFSVSEVSAHIEERAAKRRLAEHHELASRALTAPQRAFVGRVEALAAGLAAPTWPGDLVTPGVGRRLADPGVYLRVTQPRATNGEELTRASEQSSKDAFVTCLLLGAAPSEEVEPSLCEPGTGCVGDRSGRLANFRTVARGLAPFTAEWDTRAAAISTPLGIRLMDDDLAARVRDDLPAAQRAVDAASYLLIVVDEVPEGTRMPWFSTGLEAVQATPHPVRIGIFDAATGAPLARLRRDANGRAVAGASATHAVARQVQGCTLGLDVASDLDR